MKVCFFLEDSYHLFKKNKGRFGGGEIDLYLISTKLAKRNDIIVSFIVGDFGQPNKEKIDGVNLIKSKYLNIDIYNTIYHKIWRRIFFILNLFLVETDVFFTETAGEFQGIMAIISRIRGKKIIYRTAHDKDCNTYITNNWGLQGKIYKLGIQFFDLIIAQNDDQKKMWARYEGKDSIVVENGHEIVPIQKIDKQYILWVSRAVDWKQPELFINMAKEIPNQEFLMILLGDNDLSANIKMQSLTCRNIKILDYVPFNEIQEYYNYAKFFVSTSTSEGFPNTFIHACLGATPILSLNVNPDNFITKHKLGFFAEGNLSNAIEFLKNISDEEIKIMGENAIAYASAHHNIDEKVDKYIELMNALLYPKYK